MKKAFVIILLSALVVALSACRTPEKYDFLHPESEIAAVHIVEIQCAADGTESVTQLCEIEDSASFLAAFRAVDCYVYWGDPIGPYEKGETAVVVKVIYNNGDYELIAWNGQAEYTQENGYCHYAGFSVFDEDKFNSLLSSYISN